VTLEDDVVRLRPFEDADVPAIAVASGPADNLPLGWSPDSRALLSQEGIELISYYDLVPRPDHGINGA